MLSAQPDSRSSLPLGVNAVMGPAIRVRGIGGLVPAEALTAAAPVEPDSEPGSGWPVVQNNRITKGIGERALAAGGGDAGEGGSAVGGDRYAGDVQWTGLTPRESL